MASYAKHWQSKPLMLFGLKSGLAPSDPWASEKWPRSVIRSALSSPPHQDTKVEVACHAHRIIWSVRHWGRREGGEAFERERGKRNHTCKRIQLTAQSLTSETSEYVWKRCECRKSTGLLSAALQCVFNPTAACITEHMFSTRQLKQKRLFVVILSFVYICSPPPLLPSPSFSNIQTTGLVDILTAWEGDARMPAKTLLLLPCPENCSPRRQ